MHFCCTDFHPNFVIIIVTFYEKTNNPFKGFAKKQGSGEKTKFCQGKFQDIPTCHFQLFDVGGRIGGG